MKRTLALIQKTGGTVAGDKVTIKTQAAKEPKLEIWDNYGSPVERVAAKDPRWTFTGAWTEVREMRTATAKGAEASISFDGTGAIVVGPYLSNGGMADVYLDGKLDRTVDVYPDEDSNKGGEAVWHAFGEERQAHGKDCRSWRALPRLQGHHHRRAGSCSFPLTVSLTS